MNGFTEHQASGASEASNNHGAVLTWAAAQGMLPLVRRIVADLLQQEQQLTVLLISHELSIVYRYATNVLCLSGDQVHFGAPRTILTPDLLHRLYGTPVAFHVHEH